MSDARRKTRRYIIWAQPHTRSCGTRVLYMLYERLCAAGCRALLFCPEEHLEGYEYIDVLDAHTLAEDIAVYPEIVSGNPLRFKRVVRFVLYFPGLLAGEAAYHPDELLFTWWRDYCDAPELYWNTIDRSLFRDEGLPKSQDCWFANKGRKRDIPEIKQAVGITMNWPQSREELARLLKSSGTVYSFDDYSMLHDEAVLCGAKVKLVTARGLEDYQMRPLPDPQMEKAMLERFIEASQTMPASASLQAEEPFLERYVAIFYMAAARCAAAGNWPEALAFCRKAYKGKPLARPGLEKPGIGMKKARQVDKSGTQGTGPAAHLSEIEAAIQRFLGLAARGDYPGARAVLLPFLEQSAASGNGPAAAALLVLLSHCHELAGQSAEQVRAESLALLADPLNPLAVHLNAARHLQEGRFNQALHCVVPLLRAALSPLDITGSGNSLILSERPLPDRRGKKPAFSPAHAAFDGASDFRPPNTCRTINSAPSDMRRAVFAMALLGMMLEGAPAKEALMAARLPEALAGPAPGPGKSLDWRAALALAISL